MAFKEWMIRKGAPGGTARKVGEIYLHALRNNPDTSMDQFCSQFFLMRAKIGRYKSSNQLAKLSGLTADGTKWPQTLTRLVWSVLSVEVGDSFDDQFQPSLSSLYGDDRTSFEEYEKTQKARELYEKIIGEELSRSGVPSEMI